MPPQKKRKLGLKNLAMLSSYFDYIFVDLRQKSTSQTRIKPEIFVNFRPEPGPKSLARLTKLLSMVITNRYCVYSRISG